MKYILVILIFISSRCCLGELINLSSISPELIGAEMLWLLHLPRACLLLLLLLGLALLRNRLGANFFSFNMFELFSEDELSILVSVVTLAEESSLEVSFCLTRGNYTSCYNCYTCCVSDMSSWYCTCIPLESSSPGRILFQCHSVPPGLHSYCHEDLCCLPCAIQRRVKSGAQVLWIEGI